MPLRVDLINLKNVFHFVRASNFGELHKWAKYCNVLLLKPYANVVDSCDQISCSAFEWNAKEYSHEYVKATWKLSISFHKTNPLALCKNSILSHQLEHFFAYQFDLNLGSDNLLFIYNHNWYISYGSFCRVILPMIDAYCIQTNETNDWHATRIDTHLHR